MNAPRKRRTRQHVIADLSVHHVEGFVYRDGHTVQRIGSDYGYDLVVFTYDERGYFEHGLLLLQVKAAETLKRVGQEVVFDLDIRDYNLWMLENAPVILILYDASRKKAYWLPVQRYFRGSIGRLPKRGAKTIRVRIPLNQSLRKGTVNRLRALKRRGELKLVGGTT